MQLLLLIFFILVVAVLYSSWSKTRTR